MDYGADTMARVDEAASAGAQAFKDTVDQAAIAGNQAFKDSVDKSMTALNEMNAQSKRNLEALVASVTAATRGAESLSAQAMAYAKKTLEGQVEQARALSSARSIQEVLELQTAYAKSAVEGYMAEVNRASETLSTAVKDSFRPLNERATAVVETLQSAR